MRRGIGIASAGVALALGLGGGLVLVNGLDGGSAGRPAPTPSASASVDYAALAAAARESALTLPDPGPPEGDPTITHTAPRVGPDGPARFGVWLSAYLGTDGERARATMTPSVAAICISSDADVRYVWTNVQGRDVLRAGITFLCPGRVWLLR